MEVVLRTRRSGQRTVRRQASARYEMSVKAVKSLQIAIEGNRTIKPEDLTEGDLPTNCKAKQSGTAKLAKADQPARTRGGKEQHTCGIDPNKPP